jgi:hypothetical protein
VRPLAVPLEVAQPQDRGRAQRTQGHPRRVWCVRVTCAGKATEKRRSSAPATDREEVPGAQCLAAEASARC